MRRALTLFEVCTSLLLVAVAILSSLLMLPVGAKAQQMARDQLVAAAKASELIDAFSQSGMDVRGFTCSRFSDYLDVVYYDQSTPDTDELMQRALYSSAGQFDLERVVVNASQGNYPVPVAIARRLDSPGDEIQDLLDGGGMLYYPEPYAARGFTREAALTGGKRSAAPELQRLVWAVTTPAQQDALPLHPMAPTPKELWPFPPQAKTNTEPRRHVRDQLWEIGDLGTPRHVEDVQRIEAVETGASLGLYQGNNWEWLAATENPPRGKRNRWLDSIHEFRRLVNGHWMRLFHQLGPVGGAPTLWRWDPPYQGPPRWNDHHHQDANGNWQGMWQDANGLDMPGFVQIGADAVMGCPSPAIGLPSSTGRGTDIMNEDQETARWRLTEQLRQGMPSLERRVMYRTAALALWARVQQPDGDEPISIHSAPAGDLMANPDADPNVADQIGRLPAARNPLAGFVAPPADPREIHPAQVLALNYLAHAAMMVTGYKPPFVDHKDTVDASDDVNLAPDETKPYKALYKDESYLRAVWPTPGSRNDKPLPATGPAPTAAQLALIAKDVHGNPIRYRRFVGPVLNPCPPPYADRGAFDMAGVRTYATRDVDTTALDHDYEIDESGLVTSGSPAYRIPVPAILRIVDHYDGSPGDDTRWAKNAYETCVAWGMAYLRENPYDLLVPRPLNQQVMMDRALYAWDLFDETGKALRSRADGPGWYALAWPSTRAAFGAQWSWPFAIDTPGMLRDAGLSPTGDDYQWGGVDDRMPLDRAHQAQIDFANGLGLLHGFKPTAAPIQPYWNAGESPRRARWSMNDRFHPADRCRDLVLWAVDWKSYADAESAPSAPIDFSHLGRRWNGGRIAPWWMHDAEPLGNPERLFAWVDETRAETIVARAMRGSDDWAAQRGEHFSLPRQALGAYGADRNGNGAFDVGPVPPTTRMRALEVGRYVFYDPIAPTSLRN